jgi:ribonuclease BN (tRNA processing enzyme)
VRFGDLPSRIVPREVRPREQFDVGEARVRVARGNHPGGVLAYRIDFGGASLVYATDTEHYACLDPELFALAEGATMLVYDAQYTEAEYRAKVGWGHSTNVAAAELARASGVEQLVLFHHDPTRDDAGVAAMEAETQGLFAATVAAREGATFLLGRGGSPRKLVA